MKDTERMDRIVEDVAIIKAEQKVQGDNIETIKIDFKTHTDLVLKHVTDDKRTIAHFEPLLEPLQDIVNRRKLEEELKIEKDKKIKRLILRVSLFTGLLAALFGTFKLLDMF